MRLQAESWRGWRTKRARVLPSKLIFTTLHLEKSKRETIFGSFKRVRLYMQTY